MLLKVLKYTALTLLIVIVLILGLLSYTPITKAVVQGALSHFLEVNASVSTASLSIHGLKASGTLNQDDTFEINAITHSFTKATVTLHYDGNVNTFSNVATVELPYIATVLDATFTTQDLFLDLNATLLQGALLADLSLVEWNYHYQINNVDLNTFRAQQKGDVSYYTPANYFQGQLTAKGEGIIEDPYTVNFHLTGENLKLEENITKLVSPELEHPLPFTLDVNGSVGADNLNSTITLKSDFIDANLTKIYYDFNASTFDLTSSLTNHRDDIAPIKHAILDINTSLGDELNATYLLTIDNYRLYTKHLSLDFNTSDLTLDYQLSSLTPKPLNLQDDNILFGDLSYGNDNLSLKIDSKAINSPILLTLKKNQLHIISNNINLNSLQVMSNQEVIAQGHLAIEADANLSGDPLLWSAKLQSKDLKLPWEYRKDVGLKNNLALTIKVNNDKRGDIVVRPTLWSNIGIINYTALRYKPKQELLFFNVNAKNVKTSYYEVPKLNLKGSLNIKRAHLNKTSLNTSYEKVVIKDLDYSDKGITTNIAFMLSRLDRFGRLSPTYKLHGKTTLHYTPENTLVTLDSSELGHLDFEQKDKVITLSGNTLPIEEINALLDEPSIMRGDLDYTLRYSASSIKASVHSNKVSGAGELNDSVRPFTLDFATSLKYHKTRYHGDATVDTGNEHFKISNIVVDLSKNQVKSRYKLNIDKLENNTFILPSELKGPLQLHGDFEQDVYQHLTLKLTDFQLPVEWRKKLEENATIPLDTNATVEVYNDKGLISFDAEVHNTLLYVVMHKSDYNIKTGDFHINSNIKTKVLLQDTNITTAGSYTKDFISLPKTTLDTAHQTIALQQTHYTLSDSNFTTKYSLHLKPYANAPYHSKASIFGEIKTLPTIDVTMQSTSLGGEFNAHFTEKKFHLKAKNVSLVKLIKFSGQKAPISEGSFDATINLVSPSLLDANLSTLYGRSDINVTDMVLEGVELDHLIETLRKSQDLNLFQGGLGDLPIIRSVKNIPSDISGEDINSTHFGKMRFLTDINETGLHCSDCAIATEENLIAIEGGINLEHQTFDEMYVGMLFPNNCAYFIQQVEGNVSDPQVKLAAAGFKVVGGAAKSLIGNVGTVVDFGAGVVKGTGEAVGGAASYVPVVGDKTDKALTSVTDVAKDGTSKMQECKPFYTGVIQHPEIKHPKK